jgi:hypothetical protein
MNSEADCSFARGFMRSCEVLRDPAQKHPRSSACDSSHTQPNSRSPVLLPAIN